MLLGGSWKYDARRILSWVGLCYRAFVSLWAQVTESSYLYQEMSMRHGWMIGFLWGWVNSCVDSPVESHRLGHYVNMNKVCAILFYKNEAASFI